MHVIPFILVDLVHNIIKLPYSEKLLRVITFINFTVLEPPAKVFSTKFGGAAPTYDRL